MSRRKLILILIAFFSTFRSNSVFGKSFVVLYVCSFKKGNKLKDFHALRPQWHDTSGLKKNFDEFKASQKILNCKNLETDNEIAWIMTYSSKESYLSWKETNHSIFNGDKATELGFEYTNHIL